MHYYANSFYDKQSSGIEIIFIKQGADSTCHRIIELLSIGASVINASNYTI